MLGFVVKEGFKIGIAFCTETVIDKVVQRVIPETVTRGTKAVMKVGQYAIGYVVGSVVVDRLTDLEREDIIDRFGDAWKRWKIKRQSKEKKLKKVKGRKVKFKKEKEEEERFEATREVVDELNSKRKKRRAKKLERLAE